MIRPQGDTGGDHGRREVLTSEDVVTRPCVLIIIKLVVVVWTAALQMAKISTGRAGPAVHESAQWSLPWHRKHSLLRRAAATLATLSRTCVGVRAVSQAAAQWPGWWQRRQMELSAGLQGAGEGLRRPAEAAGCCGFAGLGALQRPRRWRLSEWTGRAPTEVEAISRYSSWEGPKLEHFKTHRKTSACVQASLSVSGAFGSKRYWRLRGLRHSRSWETRSRSVMRERNRPHD